MACFFVISWQLEDLKKSGGDSKSWIWQLLMETFNMQYKQVSMQVKEAINSFFLIVQKKNRPTRKIAETLEWPNQQFGPVFKRRNVLASSATPKDLEDHRRQLNWVIAFVFCSSVCWSCSVSWFLFLWILPCLCCLLLCLSMLVFDHYFLIKFWTCLLVFI